MANIQKSTDSSELLLHYPHPPIRLASKIKLAYFVYSPPRALDQVCVRRLDCTLHYGRDEARLTARSTDWRHGLPAKSRTALSQLRHVTVVTIWCRNSAIPCIRLRGHWLKQAGFTPQSLVEVVVMPARLEPTLVASAQRA